MTTANIVEPNSSPAGTVRVANKETEVSVSKDVANDSCFSVSESVITYVSPDAIMIYFKSSF